MITTRATTISLLISLRTSTSLSQRGCILKYVIRFRDKGGKEDLLKALDYTRRELQKELKRDPKDRGKQVDPHNIAEVLLFCAQDRIHREDKDFIFDIANYLHSGLMLKVADAIMP